MIRAFEYALCALLVAVAAWAPLPFASVLPRSAQPLAAVCWVALALALVAAPSVAALRPVGVPAASLALLGGLAAFQAMALPGPLVALLSPGHLEAFQRAAATMPGTELDVTLSLAPVASRFMAVVLLTTSALLIASAVAGRKRNFRRSVALAVVATALFQVLYGARHTLSGSSRIWSVEVPNMAGRLRGTYVNPNHLAMLLEIALAIAFSWFWWGLHRRRSRVSIQARTITLLLSGLVCLVLGLGLAATGSRAGLTAALLATAVQCLLVPQRRGRRPWRIAGFAILGVGLLIALPATLYASKVGAGHASIGVSLGSRLAAYRATLGLVSEYPLFGSGFGSFQELFPTVQPEALAPGVWRHAHNDWLELLATAGLVGLALALCGLVALARRMGQVAVVGRRSEDRAAALAAFGVLVAVGIHELLDFGLTMPANTAILCIVCGAAAGTASGFSGHDGEGRVASAEGVSRRG